MISTASSESSSRTASAICSFGIDFEDFAADRVVDLGQRHPVEVVAHEADELIALVRIERLQHVAEIGFVQVADQRAQRAAVVALDGARDALDEIRGESAPPRRGCRRPRIPVLWPSLFPPRILRAVAQCG